MSENLVKRRKGFACVHGVPGGGIVGKKDAIKSKGIGMVIAAMLGMAFFLGVSLNIYLSAFSSDFYARFVGIVASPIPQVCLLAGGILGVFLFKRCLNDMDQRMNNYLTGIEGENRVGNELMFLPADYTVFHSVVIPGKDYDFDHIVVGPCGIMVIETKRWNTPVKVVKNQLEYDKDKYSRDPIAQISNQALDLRSYVGDITGLKDRWIQGVICFVGENLFGATGGRIDGKYYVTVEKRLLDIILEHRNPQQFPEKEMGIVIGKLSGLCNG